MPDDAQQTQLQEGAAAWNLTLDELALARFARFAALLAEANQTLNLTRIAPDEYVPLHFLDSLALAALVKPPPGARLLDVGTGAGFPGLPLALAFPGLDVTLLDGTRKRLEFLESVIADLGLSGVRTLHGRAEELRRDPLFRERYDLVTARAVSKMPTLVTWLLPLVKVGGLAVAYKSRDADLEIEAARPQIGALGGVIEAIHDFTLPGTDVARKLVLVRKSRAVPRIARSRRAAGL